MTDAPIGRRLLARSLDLIFAAALAFAFIIPVALVALVVVAVTPATADGDTAGAVGGCICLLLAYVALEWFLLVQREGQTLGKGLLGLRVVNERTGEPLQPGPSFTRLFVLFLPFPFISLGGAYPDNTALQVPADIGIGVLLISFVMMCFKRIRRRTLHDYAGGSRVVVAAKRKIDLRKDLALMVPGKVDMTKRL